MRADKTSVFSDKHDRFSGGCRADGVRVSETVRQRERDIVAEIMRQRDIESGWCCRQWECEGRQASAASTFAATVTVTSCYGATLLRFPHLVDPHLRHFIRCQMLGARRIQIARIFDGFLKNHGTTVIRRALIPLVCLLSFNTFDRVFFFWTFNTFWCTTAQWPPS